MGVLVIAVVAMLLVVVGLFAGAPWFFNRLSPTVDGRRRARDDDYFFADQCATGLMSRYRRLNRRLPSDPRCKFSLVPFGGVNFGVARVGNVGAGAVKDFTAVGDVVNTAARLQGCAAPGEIVMSQAVYERVRDQYPNAVRTRFDLKGKADTTEAHVLRLEGSDENIE
jgi:class 3 adenylate cyclase